VVAGHQQDTECFPVAVAARPASLDDLLPCRQHRAQTGSMRPAALHGPDHSPAGGLPHRPRDSGRLGRRAPTKSQR
jgi:hypothetical protein